MNSTHQRTQHIIDAIEIHHGSIRAELTGLVDSFVSVVDAREPHEPARSQLVTFLRDELLLHLETERKLLHVVGSGFESTEKLADFMAIGHRQILEQFHTLEEYDDEHDSGMDLAVAAGTILALIELRLETENTVLLPALAANGVDLETLLAGRAELLGDTEEKA